MTQEIQVQEDAPIQLTRRETLVELTRQDGRQLVSIRRVDDLLPIPKADRIETAMIGGWPVVVKKGEFQVGQIAMFFEPDSFLNGDDPRFAFLGEKRVVTTDADGKETVSVSKTLTDWNGIEGIRLKSIKLKKQLSQGLLLSLMQFPEIAQLSEDGTFWLIRIPVGQQGGDEGDQLVDVFQAIDTYPDELSDEYKTVRALNFTTTLGVIKWEKIEKQSGGANLTGRPAGNFPSFLRKSDQPRCQGLNQEIFGYDPRTVPFNPEGIPDEAFAALRREGKVLPDGQGGWFRMYPPSADRNEIYEVTLKMDGSSMTCYRLKVRDEEGNDVQKFGVCSRNLELKIDDPENAENTFVKTFNEQVLPYLVDNDIGGNIALQGELMGPGIQGNPEGFTDHRFFVYNIYDIDQERFLLPEERWELLLQLRENARGCGLEIPLREVPIHGVGTLAEFNITDMQELLEASDGESMVNLVREGLVYKSLTREFQFKAISNAWTLLNDA